MHVTKELKTVSDDQWDPRVEVKALRDEFEDVKRQAGDRADPAELERVEAKIQSIELRVRRRFGSL